MYFDRYNQDVQFMSRALENISDASKNDLGINCVQIRRFIKDFKYKIK